MASQNVVFNKRLIIRSNSNGNNNPLVQHSSTFVTIVFIFSKDNTSIKIDSVDWDNIVLANISQSKNISVELNNCHFNISMGVGLIYFSSDIKGIDLNISNSEVNGNGKQEYYPVIGWNFGTLGGDENVQFINSSFKFINSSFKGVVIAAKGLSNLHIEKCFFKSAFILIQSSSCSSNATITNCNFSNNTEPVMYLLNSIVSIENTTFMNNRNLASLLPGTFLKARFSNVTLWGVTFYQNENYRTLLDCEACNMEI